MTATCLNGDCLELMKDLPDKSVDLFLCDLPYGCLKACLKANCEWDEKIDLVQFWNQVKRLCKNDNTPVLMFCNTKFGNDLINSNRDWFRYDLVLNKQQGTNFLHANTRPMTSHEMIYVFSKKGAFYKRIDHPVEGKEKYYRPEYKRPDKGIYGNGLQNTEKTQEGNNRCPLSVIKYNFKRDKRHPTAKAIPLLQWLIERYSNEGDTVLDPTAGSFNSGRAAVELGRNYIGMEMNADFYEKNKL
jgi:DNA modification methylase